MKMMAKTQRVSGERGGMLPTGVSGALLANTGAHARTKPKPTKSVLVARGDIQLSESD